MNEMDQELFLISCRAITEAMIEKTILNLNHMTEDQVHVLLLDDCYNAESSGVQMTQFQNAMTTAVLLAAIERRKK